MPLLQSRHYAIICYCACADLLREIADHASFCQQCEYKLWSLTWQWTASRMLVPWRIHAVNPSDITFRGFYYHEATRFIEGGPAASRLELLLGPEVFTQDFLECTNVIKNNGIMVIYCPPAHNSGKVPDEKLFLNKYWPKIAGCRNTNPSLH